VNGIKRWQFFAHNGATQRLEAFNLEVAGDGLFNPQGTQIYTKVAREAGSPVNLLRGGKPTRRF